MAPGLPAEEFCMFFGESYSHSHMCRILTDQFQSETHKRLKAALLFMFYLYLFCGRLFVCCWVLFVLFIGLFVVGCCFFVCFCFCGGGGGGDGAGILTHNYVLFNLCAFASCCSSSSSSSSKCWQS